MADTADRGHRKVSRPIRRSAAARITLGVVLVVAAAGAGHAQTGAAPAAVAPAATGALAVLAVLLAVAVIVLALLAARRARRIGALAGQLRAARDETAATGVRLREASEARDRAEAVLRQAQRANAVGQIAAGVAHDFNNMLMVLLGNLDLLQQTTTLSQPAAERLARMHNTAERAGRLTEQLLQFARREPLGPVVSDLNAVVRGMVELVDSATGGITRITTRLAEEPWQVLADPTDIELVILNLAINARDAMPNGGALTIETANVSLGPAERPDDPPPGDYAMVAVRDSGIGMAPEVQARACEPFFTTKSGGQGGGLGLAQVRAVARQCGGGLRIDSTIGRGTVVRVYLARAAAATEPLAAPSAAAQPGGAKGAPRRRNTVLLVDDDPAVRSATGMVLETLGYSVLQSHSGRAALNLLVADPGITVMLTDVAMPGMNGAELARLARGVRPGLPIVFFSGYADPEAIAGDPILQRIVRKPFRSTELAAQIEAAMAEAGPAAA